MKVAPESIVVTVEYFTTPQMGAQIKDTAVLTLLSIFIQHDSSHKLNQMAMKSNHRCIKVVRDEKREISKLILQTSGLMICCLIRTL